MIGPLEIGAAYGLYKACSDFLHHIAKKQRSASGEPSAAEIQDAESRQQVLRWLKEYQEEHQFEPDHSSTWFAHAISEVLAKEAATYPYGQPNVAPEASSSPPEPSSLSSEAAASSEAAPGDAAGSGDFGGGDFGGQGGGAAGGGNGGS